VKGVSLTAQILNVRPRDLLCRVRFQMPALRRKPGAEFDVDDALSIAAFVAKCVTSPVSDCRAKMGRAK